MGEKTVYDYPRPIPGWKPSTPAVDVSSFEQSLTEHPAVAVHFWATWNGHDQVLDRSIQAIVAQFSGRLAFMSCDADSRENESLRGQCKIAMVPALAVFVKGKQV